MPYPQRGKLHYHGVCPRFQSHAETGSRRNPQGIKSNGAVKQRKHHTPKDTGAPCPGTAAATQRPAEPEQPRGARVGPDPTSALLLLGPFIWKGRESSTRYVSQLRQLQATYVLRICQLLPAGDLSGKDKRMGGSRQHTAIKQAVYGPARYSTASAVSASTTVTHESQGNALCPVSSTRRRVTRRGKRWDEWFYQLIMCPHMESVTTVVAS